ncbi:nuclear transport factor 2 family protein [Microbaculum marinum]|uniref:Nuclear transport factor 2 family protein n=1 Tax=Microbaculum marinum TaxID=1764581 RepID=A0AAW9RV50_9HYPH
MFYTTLMRALVVGAMSALHVLAPAAPRAEEAARVIEQRLRQWTEDFNAGRTERLCDLFAVDLIANYRGQPEKSFNSICSALQRDVGGGARAYRYDLDIDEVIVSGDLAVVRLVWHLTVTDRETGTTVASSDRGIDVFRRQPDGQWRIARYLAYEIEDE